MLDFIVKYSKHIAAGTGIAATIHIIFGKKIADMASGFWSAAGEWFFHKIHGGKKSKKFTGYQIGRMFQRMKDMEKELKAVKKEQSRCNRDRNKCEAKNLTMSSQLTNLQSICDTLTKKMMAMERKVTP